MTAPPAAAAPREPGVRIIEGDALSVLKTLPSESVQVCVTSPPYFALRDYGTGRWEGGDSSCDHLNGPLASDKSTLAGYTSENVKVRTGGMPFKDRCGKCGAVRVDGQIGLERTPADFIAALIEVFHEVRRVLHPSGLVFCNLGDSYSGSGKGPTGHNGLQNAETRQGFESGYLRANGERSTGGRKSKTEGVAGIPAKNLLLIPERFAIAMQDDGWIVRSRVAWCKTSAMPESVRDRPTSAWEHVWMFAKSRTYYWDQEAVRQPYARLWDGDAPNGTTLAPGSVHTLSTGQPTGHVRQTKPIAPLAGANLRNYWLLGPSPLHESHFAAFPPEIPRRCILAGSRPGDTVLDPFGGSGTTGLVADRLGRSAILIELNPEYAEMARQRIARDAGSLFGDAVTVERPTQLGLLEAM